MQVVQPIRSIAKINRCYEIARAHDKQRKPGETCWELLLLIGFNTSLRVSDFTRLKVDDIRGAEYARITAKKTGKEARILINPTAKKEINRLLRDRAGNEYILQSRKKSDGVKPITRQRVYQIMNAIAAAAGITDNIGCHTLRKTFGYHYYKSTGDVVGLQRILCHTNRRETLLYIGIVQDNIDENIRGITMLAGKRVKVKYDTEV